MSVNTGGFFFSNPTSTHLPNNSEDEERNAILNGGGGNAGFATGYAGNVGMPCNFNANSNQQPIMNNNFMNGNNNPNQQQGNFLLNNTNVNMNSNAIMMGNPTNNVGNLNVGGNSVNNAFFGNQNQNSMNMVNNTMNSNLNPVPVQNTNTGFGSFFFNPLASLFASNNSNSAIATNNNMNTTAVVNNNALGVNNNAIASNSVITNRLLNNSILENSQLPNNALNANTMNNNNIMGGVYQQQNSTMQIDDSTNIKSPALQPMNNQFSLAASQSQSPMPMGFMTPNQGPTPCHTPPADMSKSPMFHDANSFVLNDNVIAQPPIAANNNPSVSNQGNTYQVAAVSQDTNVQPMAAQDTAQQSETTYASSASKSLFVRGISSMGTALGAVATYVNQSFLSGIPFHIADRAMKESKETYAKWWEDGINNYNAKKNKRKGSTDEEDNVGDSDYDSPAAKRRRLEMGKAEAQGSSGEFGSGSSLSVSLKKHYDDLGIDTSSRFIEYQQQRENEALLAISSQQPANVEVDSSIIKPRRSQFERKSNKPDKQEAEPVESIDGYDAFNNYDDFYDFGVDNASHDENENGDTVQDVGQTLTYDSLGSFYTTNEEANNTGAPTIANAPLKSPLEAGNSTTITSNSTLNGTMQVIQELLEEKNRASEENEMLQMLSSPRDWVKKSIRSELIDALQGVQGDVKDKRFLSSLDILSNFYKTSGRDARVSPWSGRRKSDPGIDGGTYGYSGSEIGGPTSSDLLEGSWLNMSRPNYVECLGNNPENDFMYTLGRMSFDMFQPGGLICSVQSTHNTIKIIGEREELPAFVPKSLREEVISLCDSGGDNGTGSKSRPLLRSYDIAVSLTIEPPSTVGQPEPPATPTPTKRMRALMSVKGYVLPDPDTPNRLTVWFTGGKLSPARLSSGDGAETDDEDQAEYNQSTATKPSTTAGGGGSDDDGYGGFEDWTAMFAKGKWRKTLGERARAMAAKLLLGADVPNKMEEDGHMEYTLHRPVGGHGKVYVDVLYLDEDILIMRGHHGTIYAMARSGVSQRYKTMRQSKKDE